MKHITDWINENKGEIKHYVDGILVSEDEKILILRRANYMKNFGGCWGFVGGSVDKKDKNNKEAIIREIKEETGIELTFNEQQKMKAVDKQGHEREDGSIGSDTEYWLIKLETTQDIKISREHSKYEWVGPEETKERNRKFMPDVFHYIQLYFQGDL
jgi:8-oxo-dGTP pyrophosphatase MutT (NUDIX family)